MIDRLSPQLILANNIVDDIKKKQENNAQYFSLDTDKGLKPLLHVLRTMYNKTSVNEKPVYLSVSISKCVFRTPRKNSFISYMTAQST